MQQPAADQQRGRAERRTVQDGGPVALVGYALLRDDGRQDPVLIAADAALAALALRQHAPTPVR